VTPRNLNSIKKAKDPHFAGDFGDRSAKLSLAEGEGDLLFGKLALFHGKTSFLAL